MTSISVREPDRRPKADAVASVRAERRRKIGEKRKLRNDMQATTPRAVRAGRIMVTLNPSPDVLRECVCGHEPWKWQIECPKCGAALE